MIVNCKCPGNPPNLRFIHAPGGRRAPMLGVPGVGLYREVEILCVIRPGTLPYWN